MGHDAATERDDALVTGRILERVHERIEPCAHALRVGRRRVDRAEHPPRRLERVGFGRLYAVGQDGSELLVFHDGLSFSRRKISRSSFTARCIRTLTVPTSTPRRSAIASSFM